jgi:hypothetical protein
MSPVHAEILRTPDSAPGSKDLYRDNVVDQLNPAGGIEDPGDGSGGHARNIKRAAERAAENKAGKMRKRECAARMM